MFRTGIFLPASRILAVAILAFLGGCSKRSAEALVIEKEHIAARKIVASPSSPAESSPAPGVPQDSAPDEEYQELGADEIAVDGYVMKAEARGTARDPRATDREQWLVKVELAHGGRKIRVHADQPKWAKLKIGDRVQVAYREGKYTGTVWSAEIK